MTFIDIKTVIIVYFILYILVDFVVLIFNLFIPETGLNPPLLRQNTHAPTLQSLIYEIIVIQIKLFEMEEFVESLAKI